MKVTPSPMKQIHTKTINHSSLPVPIIDPLPFPVTNMTSTFKYNLSIPYTI